MNKRLPILLSLLGVILLAMSIAYWVLQLVRPPERPMAAVQTAQMADPPIDAAASLFGGQMAVATASNYQLTGIVSAGRNSVAIIVADGAQPKALRLGKELSPGIKLAEVYPRYVMLSDNGAMKRIDLAPDTKGGAQVGGAGGMAPPGIPNNAGSAQPMMPSPTAPAGNAIPEPPMSPGAVAPQLQVVNPGDVGQHDAPQQQQQQQQQQNGNPNQGMGNNGNQPTPLPNQIQMPPPTRAVGVPGAMPAVQ